MSAAAGIITTFAGNNALGAGYFGDGGAATSAQLWAPGGVALDTANNLYIADSTNSVIRKVSAATGIITTVAGDHASGAGYSGDGGAATSAQLATPLAVKLNSSNDLFIADFGNSLIREVDAATGIITTVAGDHALGPGYSGNGGAATSAQLNGPYSIATDSSGDLYIADTNNGVIREVNASTGVISTLVSNNSSGYSGDGGAANGALLNAPVCTAVDSTGNVYIADYSNNVIRKVTPSGTISTVAGNYSLGAGYSGNGGAATSAQLSGPNGIVLDSSNNLYIVDLGNDVIRKVVTATGIITTIAGDGTSGYTGDAGAALSAELNSPLDITLDSSNNLYIVDSGNNVIRKVNAVTGIITTVAGHGVSGFSGDDGLATDAALNAPESAVLDGVGNLYITDTGNNVIRKVNASTGVITTVAGIGLLAGYSGDGNLATSARLNAPSSIALDGFGNLYIADYSNDVIRKVDAITGIITTVAGTPGTPGYAGDGGAATAALLNGSFRLVPP